MYVCVSRFLGVFRFCIASKPNKAPPKCAKWTTWSFVFPIPMRSVAKKKSAKTNRRTGKVPNKYIFVFGPMYACKRKYIHTYNQVYTTPTE